MITSATGRIKNNTAVYSELFDCLGLVIGPAFTQGQPVLLYCCTAVLLHLKSCCCWVVVVVVVVVMVMVVLMLLLMPQLLFSLLVPI